MRLNPTGKLTLALIDVEGNVSAFEAFDVAISAESGYGTTGIEASLTKQCGWADAGSSTEDKLSVLGLTDDSTKEAGSGNSDHPSSRVLRGARAQ